MALGKAPEVKILKLTANIQDQLWRAYVTSEQTAADAWKSKWGWILEEYDKLQTELEEISKNTVMRPGKKLPPETRTIKPIPNTTSHECGWLAAREEFKLERYGPDIYKCMPFKSL